MVGGVETYLNGIISELHRSDISLAFWSELDAPKNRSQIELPDGVPAWCASELGNDKALAALRDWQPDLLYVHKLNRPATEAKLLKIAPAVFFAHDYYGTCISGAKTFKHPQITPCSRRFGWQCLLHYYPHRCGGWSPLTMAKLYHVQSKRLKLLHHYKAVVTHSEHLYSEYLQHGLEPARLHNLTYYSHQISNKNDRNTMLQNADASLLLSNPIFTNIISSIKKGKPYYQMLFLGRMDLLKGGRVFLDALHQVRVSLDRPLQVTFAGDGPDRPAWEKLGKQVQSQTEGLSIEFVGWKQKDELDALWAACDLLVMPSLWPEPFGLVGVEAGLHGVPVAAFSVGGIPSWLVDGVNGHLAPGNPPTSTGIAKAITKCLEGPITHARLKLGAFRMAQQYNIRNHMSALLEVFESVLGGIQAA